MFKLFNLSCAGRKEVCSMKLKKNKTKQYFRAKTFSLIHLKILLYIQQMTIVTLTDQRWGNIWQSKQSFSMVSLKNTVRFENHKSLSLCTLLRAFHTALAHIYAQARALLRCQNSINESQTPDTSTDNTTCTITSAKSKVFLFSGKFDLLIFMVFSIQLDNK